MGSIPSCLADQPLGFHIELAAIVWTIDATAKKHGAESLRVLKEYLQACAEQDGKLLSGEALARVRCWAFVLSLNNPAIAQMLER